MIHEHHRKRRPHCTEEEYDAPWNKIRIGDPLHDWIHANPEKAYECGLLVHSWADPREVMIEIPEGFTLPKSRAKRERKSEKPRNRVNVTVNVPKDEREDGAGILDDLIQQGRELLAEDMGWDEDVPAYFVLVAILHDWLTGFQSIVEQGE